jgi:hypothetical protein
LTSKVTVEMYIIIPRFLAYDEIMDQWIPVTPMPVPSSELAPLLSRRALLALLSAGALPFLFACGGSRGASAPPATPAQPDDAEALALLSKIAEDLLRLSPETATSLGIDRGARAALRSQLGDRSADGVQRVASQVRAALDRIRAVPTDDLSHPVRTSVAVVRSAYTTALAGFLD